jgi:hypothetical protein
MVNRHVKGQSYERLIRNYLSEVTNWTVINPARIGFDGSDIDLVWMNIEAKNHKLRRVSQWLKQAESDSTTGLSAVIFKRRGKGAPGFQYLVMYDDVAAGMGITFPDIDFGVITEIDGIQYYSYNKSGLEQIEEMTKVFSGRNWIMKTKNLRAQPCVVMELDTFIGLKPQDVRPALPGVS